MSENRNKITLRQLLSSPYCFLAFGFGSGLSPIAPGTIGSLAAAFFFLIVRTKTTSWYYLFGCVVFCMLAIFICNRASKYIKSHDHPGIVIDEFAGLFITFIFIPFSWMNLLFGFLLFRFFDILKPWPINVIDKKIDGGLGVVLDDILAGIFACLSLHVIYQFSFLF